MGQYDGIPGASEASNTGGGGEDPIDAYDRQHGKAGADAPTMSEAEAWGTNLNPVQNPSLPAKNLSKVGG